MIVTITPNAAVDTTYTVPALVPNSSHRVSTVHSRAGGKGVNVARVLTGQGVSTLAVAFAGGAAGAELRTDLTASGIAFDLFPVAGQTRRTVSIVAEGDATVFNEPGPLITAAEWASFRRHLGGLLADADVVVLSGSLPPGLAADAYAELVGLARANGCRTVLDTTGDPLLAGAAAGADVVKPNAVELREATGESDPCTAAEALRATGAGTVVASLGADGLLAVGEHGRWLARPDRVVHGNPTGAGDALVAALATGLAADHPWPYLLREAVAWSAAAVAAPLAGDLDTDALHELRVGVTLEELRCHS
ncbi:1-phosphofructokinase family hexose kinase [Alloactinosynnema sp. L-07]|uniref:1-phosphofructokinase family hexose kinase n=1 Tax=Alloactinosynnema sp. L-07 TaxID=1653480 RepID=UPI0006B5F7FC|nr:hexose kinase [Alloactinosynnema sp. L-07]